MQRSVRIFVFSLCLAGIAVAQPEIAPPPVQQETEITRLTQRFKDGSEQTRMEIIQRLQVIGGPQILPLLLLALEDADENVRWHATSAFEMKPLPEAIDPLLALLKTARAEARPQVVRALQYYLDKRVTDVLLAALPNETPVTQYQLIMALQERDDPRIYPALMAATRDQNPEPRAAAARFLPRFPTEDASRRIVEMLADPVPSVRSAAVGAIAEIVYERGNPDAFRDAVKPIIGMLSDANVHVRSTAAGTLGALRDPATVPPLIALLNDPDLQVKDAAIRALYHLRDPRAVKPLLTMDNAGDSYWQSTIAETLMRIGKPAISLCIDLYDHTPDAKRRHSILQCMRNLRGMEIAQFYARVLSDEKDATLRLDAMQTFDNNFTPRVVPVLLATLKDADPKLRQGAVTALQRSREVATGNAQVPLLQDPVKEVRLAVAQQLSYRSDPRATETLVAFLKDDDLQVRLAAIQTLSYQSNAPVEALLGVLHDPSPEVRQVAVDAMRSAYARAGKDDRARVADALIERLKDENGEVRQQTVSMLRCITTSRVIDAIIQALLNDPKPEVREYAAWSLKSMGDDRGVEPLMQAIRDPVEWARSAAKDALGEIGDPRAIPALLAIKDAGNEGDRWRTGSALAKLGVTVGIFVPKEFTADEWAVVAPVFGRDEMSTDELLAWQARQPKLAATLMSFLGRSEKELGNQQRAMRALTQLAAPGAAEVIVAFYERLRKKRIDSWYAVEMLCQLHDSHCIQPMIDQVRADTMRLENLYDCGRKITILGTYDDPRVITLCKEMMGSDQFYVKYAAAGVLGRRGDADAMAVLMQPLGQLEQDEKHEAIQALGCTGNPRALDVLLNTLDEQEDYINYSAVTALGDWLNVNDDPANYERIARALLKAAAQEKSGESRLRLLDILVKRHDNRVLDDLITFVVSNTPNREYSAVTYLANYRGVKVVDALLRVLAEGSFENRVEAAVALGTMGDPRAVPALLRAIREDTTRVRVKAIQSLGALKATQAIDALISLLEEPGLRIRTAAAHALTAITAQDLGEDAARWRAWRGERTK